MGRIGCRPTEARALARRVARRRASSGGVCTHFAGADMPERDYTDGQIRLFTQCLDEIRRLGIDPGLVHASNTGGVLGFPEAHFRMVRVGIAIYGYAIDNGGPAQDLRPVMELTTRVALSKRSRPARRSPG
jgi:alanine racemase